MVELLEGGSVADGKDFFISHATANLVWAEWIAVELERASYSTILQTFDFHPGQDFVHLMQEAAATAGRTIAVLSPAYLVSEFGEAEWRSAFVKDPTGELGLIIPVRVQPCEPAGLLASRIYVDLVDVDEAVARKRLLAAVNPSRARRTTAPFPGQRVGHGHEGVRFPGLGPAVSNLGRRNPNFTGREAVLDRLNSDLQAENAAAVLVSTGAVHGLGGVGKTQVALEYAHRFRSDYDVIWWIPADEPTTAVAVLAELARRLDVEESVDQEQMVKALFDRLRRRERWLLVYDNAERPDDLVGLLPPGGLGHVLVTSRWTAWGSHAAQLPLEVLSRDESITFLQRRLGRQDAQLLSAVAELLGDLPLALEEAAAYLDQTKDSLPHYLEMLQTRGAELLHLPSTHAVEPTGDVGRVATVWSVSLDRVQRHAPAAQALLNLLAYLAPAVPRTLPVQHTHAMPAILAAALADPLAYNQTLAAIGRFSLASVTSTMIEMHRLVQAVVQGRMDDATKRIFATAATELLKVVYPDESWEPRTWTDCDQLLPHVLVVTDHARRLGVAGEQAGLLLDRASTYLRERGQYRQALPLAKQALDITMKTFGPSHLETAWRHDELGRVLRALGDLSGARSQYKRALEIGEVMLGPDHLDMGTWRNGLGLVLQDLGDHKGARDQFERALAIHEPILGSEHPDIGVLRNNLGLVLRALGDLRGARQQFEVALKIGEAAPGGHPDVGIWHNNLGGVLRDLGDLAGARTQFELALGISEAALGSDHPDMGIWRNNLGGVLRDLGDLAGARTQFELALQISQAALGSNHPTIGIRRRNLGGVLRELGDLAGAREQYELALHISETVVGTDHAHTRAIRATLADLA